MKVFLTGATGFIGAHLTAKLAGEGHDITVLVRKPEDIIEFERNGLKVVNGDLFNTQKLREGMNGCDWVFHLAAYAKPTSFDKNLPYRTNVEGTINIIEAAEECKVKKIVLTSTAGVMGFSTDGLPVNEKTNENIDFHTEYERTKSLTEKIAAEHSGKIDISIVNPSRVFGPGKLTKSNSITRIMKLYGTGIWRIIPGDGNAVGNYAFIDDVVEGHILAARHGKTGERYILGGEDVSFSRLFDALGKAYGNKRWMVKISDTNLKRMAELAGGMAALTGKPPLVSDQWIDKYLKNWILSSEKACSELFYHITPFEEALQKTVDWLKNNRR
jgi:farnesol dehydrogenase